MSHPDRCIIYSANGDQYLEEAIHAGIITKTHCGDIPLILHSDRSIDDRRHVFDRVFVREPSEAEETHKFLFKIRSMCLATCDQILFLDADAAMVREAGRSLFDLLESFDIALAHAVLRTSGPPCKQIPDCFPEFNSGVIAFRNTDRVNQQLRTWAEIYERGWVTHPHDQGALRNVLYFSDLRIATLPPEYNHRKGKLNDCVIWHNRQLFQRYRFPSSFT